MSLRLTPAATIAVASRSFSQTAHLRQRLSQYFPNCYFNDSGVSLGGDLLADFLDTALGAVVALEKIDDELLAKLPRLRVISKYGVGLDSIDQDALRNHGIQLLHTPGVNRYSVAELALGSAISLMHRAPQSHRGMMSGLWSSERGRDLRGSIVGIVGCGNVGRELARLVGLIGCTVLAHDLLPQTDFFRENGIRAVSLQELLASSDVVSIHLPLDDTTRGFIGSIEFDQMKEGSVFLNFSRGGIVDEKALLAALESGRVGSAAVDVFADEPNITNALPMMPNVLATAHIGGSTQEAVDAMGNAAIDRLIELLSDK
jgi:phosphoglycerate dehydrogenase-like enzyme